MKTNKNVNVICSIVVLCLIIGGIIFLLTSMNNRTIAIIGSVIMGVLGLGILCYIIKELSLRSHPQLNAYGSNSTNSDCKTCNNVWLNIFYVVMSVIIIGLCVYLFTSPSRVNFIIGIVVLACLAAFIIYYIIKRLRR